MPPTKVLLAIMPHPDDESLGFGGTLAKYSADPTVQTHVVTVTRGQKGNRGDPSLKVTRKTLPQVREAELRCATKILGIDQLDVLNYIDGELPEVDEKVGIADMIKIIRRIKPQVIITYGPDGGYGHPDHIAVCKWVTAAVVHTPSVKKLYYYAFKKDLVTMFAKQFGKIPLNGETLSLVYHPSSYINATIDCSAFVDIKFKAIHCHHTQIQDIKKFELLRQVGVKTMISTDHYHRAYPIGGEYNEKETDLFAGI